MVRLLLGVDALGHFGDTPPTGNGGRAIHYEPASVRQIDARGTIQLLSLRPSSRPHGSSPQPWTRQSRGHPGRSSFRPATVNQTASLGPFEDHGVTMWQSV